MSLQRIVEGNLAEKSRPARFWRRQAKSAKDEAWTLQIRAALAEVQQATIVEEFAMEQQRFSMLRNKTETTSKMKKLKGQEK